MRKRSKLALSFLAIIVAAVALRAMLPMWVLDYANKRLQALDGYDGRIEDVDLALWRGAYRMRGLVIRREASSQEPFVTTEEVNLSIEWRSLLRGKVVGSVYFDRPILRAIQADSVGETQLGEGVNWFELLKGFFPFRFNTIGIRDGVVFFRAPGIATQDAIKAANVEGQVTNLTNAAGKDEMAFAAFDLNASVLGDAPLAVTGKVDPNARYPTLDLNLTLEGVRLVALNPWLKAYAGIDAEGGSFELATELAAKDGRFAGYVKPLMQDVRIHGNGEDAGNPLRQVWERLVGLVAEIFENQPKDQVATRIPLSGTLEDPDVGVLAAIAGVLKNAFVGAFASSLENSISLATLDEDSRNLIREKNPQRDNKRNREDRKDAVDFGPRSRPR